MSTVELYCWCHSDGASVLLYFTHSVLSGLNLLNVEDRVAQLRLNHVFNIPVGPPYPQRVVIFKATKSGAVI